MRPTDAQIMRKALEEIAEDPTGVSTYQAEIAKAALTAAAEVGEPTIHEVQRRALIKCEEIERATIERCAQVVENMRVKLGLSFKREIAAAIRALKDET